MPRATCLLLSLIGLVLLALGVLRGVSGHEDSLVDCGSVVSPVTYIATSPQDQEVVYAAHCAREMAFATGRTWAFLGSGATLLIVAGAGGVGAATQRRRRDV
ncbi:hypothetical protein [Nocardioides sp.]|uniref:hypothetical protein n=1 Tax=Nocardioides sp. TaxID=35761 RepID=UPI003510E7DE